MGFKNGIKFNNPKVNKDKHDETNDLVDFLITQNEQILKVLCSIECMMKEIIKEK